jgi:release factor glutamine methyltransferase
MKTADWLREATTKLMSADVRTARLDALVLLEDVMGRDRAWLLARAETEIPAGKVRKLTNLLSRRAAHEPLAYIRGHTEFYGREFVITPAVLEPRPESETMIDLFKALPVFSGPGSDTKSSARKVDGVVKIADVGTGSGTLGITAALEVPNTSIELLDVDPGALKVAKMNVDKFTLNLNIIKSNLLRQVNRDYDILLCNLPYVPDGFKINPAAMREPKSAIFGGPDGLDLYRKLFDQLKSRLNQPLYILSEALPAQHAALREIAGLAGYGLVQTDGFIQVFTTMKIPAKTVRTGHKNR